jgi:branched-chain amino acid transport system ATP-binding protein
MNLLVADSIHKNFGALKALSDVSFEIQPRKILGIVGPNGSGKTTLFNVLTGIYKSDGGNVLFEDHQITGLPTHKICRMGLVKTSQIVKPFTRLSVMENVLVGGLYGRGLGLNRARREAMEFLNFVGLSEVAHQPAGSITVAMRRRLELARALATGPKIILLDENMAGLTPVEIDAALELLRKINEEGIALVVVEHIMQAVMGISQYVIVLDYGKKIAEGAPEQIVNDPQVIKAFLGDEYV